jgi:hypothetical protein
MEPRLPPTISTQAHAATNGQTTHWQRSWSSARDDKLAVADADADADAMTVTYLSLNKSRLG